MEIILCFKKKKHNEKKLIVMINNSTNINKTNNYPSSQTIKHKTNHDMTLEIQVLTLNRKTCGIY